MPLLDADKNAVGCVQLESRETGNYARSFMIIDFSTHKLRLYPEEAEFAANLSALQERLEINCQYITKVTPASMRPKVLNCLEIETTTRTYILSVDSKEERDDWIDSITKASMRQTSGRGASNRTSLKGDRTTGYQTKVVGGVVQKTPITASNGERVGDDAESGAGKQAERVQHRGFPRIIKAGYGIKLGAVMKNWKRRFFVLTEISLSYYKTIEEMDPIKSVSVGEVSSVSARSRDLPGKEHLFEVVTPHRTFYVQVETEEDMEDWVKAFNGLLNTIKPTLQQHAKMDDETNTHSTNGSDNTGEQQLSIV